MLFHPDTLNEIIESYNWYESKTQGLGNDFIAELESSFRIIMELPETWPAISGKLRRYLLNKFPFGVVYQHNNNDIIVLAVMHLSRKPDYWHNRINH